MLRTARARRPAVVRPTTATTALSPYSRKRRPRRRQAPPQRLSRHPWAVPGQAASHNQLSQRMPLAVGRTGTRRMTASTPTEMTTTKTILSRRVCLRRGGRHRWAAEAAIRVCEVPHHRFPLVRSRLVWPRTGAHRVGTAKAASTRSDPRSGASSARTACVRPTTGPIHARATARYRPSRCLHSDRAARASRPRICPARRRRRCLHHYHGRGRTGRPRASAGAARASRRRTTARTTRRTARR